MDFSEHPLDSIAIGIVEARSFLFSYGNPGPGSESDKKKKSGAGHTAILKPGSHYLVAGRRDSC